MGEKNRVEMKTQYYRRAIRKKTQTKNAIDNWYPIRLKIS